jgi:hypothetical protein
MNNIDTNNYLIYPQNTYIGHAIQKGRVSDSSVTGKKEAINHENLNKHLQETKDFYMPRQKDFTEIDEGKGSSKKGGERLSEQATLSTKAEEKGLLKDKLEKEPLSSEKSKKKKETIDNRSHDEKNNRERKISDETRSKSEIEHSALRENLLPEDNKNKDNNFYNKSDKFILESPFYIPSFSFDNFLSNPLSFFSPFFMPFCAFPSWPVFNPFGMSWMPFSFQEPVIQNWQETPFYNRVKDSIKNTNENFTSMFNLKNLSPEKVRERKTGENRLSFKKINDKIVDMMSLGVKKTGDEIKEVKKEIPAESIDAKTEEKPSVLTEKSVPPVIGAKTEEKPSVLTEKSVPPVIGTKTEEKPSVLTEKLVPPVISAKTEEKPPVLKGNTGNLEKLYSLITEGQKKVLDLIKYSPKRLSQFQNLTEKEQLTFLNLSYKEDTKKSFLGKLFGRSTEEGVDKNLIALLESGKLQNKDNTGNSLLHNLSKMNEQSFTSPLDGEKIMNETIETILRPDVIHQGHKGTCTVTTLEYINAKNHPAEYVRIISGLTDIEGNVKLRNGDTMKRLDGIKYEDDSGRRDIDRIYQASMMNYANGKDKIYDNKADKHYKLEEVNPDEVNDGTLKKLIGKGTPEKDYKGLYDEELNKALNAVLPYDSVVEKNYNIKSDFIEKEIKASLSSGKEVPVTLTWGKDDESSDGKGYHKLAVENIDDEYVYLRNPHGDFDSGSKTDLLSDDTPKREAILSYYNGKSGGHIRITKDEFHKQLYSYNLPNDRKTMSFILDFYLEEESSLNKEYKEKIKEISLNTNQPLRALEGMLDRPERFQIKDSEGNTVLDKLLDISNQKFFPGIDRDKILMGTIKNIENCNNFRQIGHSLTDLDLIEKDFIKDNPLEFIRIISELSGEKGEAKLQEGIVLKRTEPLPDNENLSIRGLYAAELFHRSLEQYMKDKNLTVFPENLLNKSVKN